MGATQQQEGLLTAAQPVIYRHEGLEFKVYPDEKGIPTIAAGFNLLDPDARTLCEGCGADYDALLAGTAELTESQCTYLYQQLALDALEWLTLLFPAFFTYTLNRQIALLDMGYNLGETRFRDFKMMISAILEGNWAEAAAQARNSEWATEVGERAIQDESWLAGG